MPHLDKHHAVLFEGDRAEGITAAHAYVADIIGIPIAQNPDVSMVVHERVTLEYTRQLKERAAQRPFGDAQAFIIACDSILYEAQNALLKLLEEPAKNTHFIFIMPSRALLLPTVQSRMYMAGQYIRATVGREIATQFLDADNETRQHIIASIIKSKDRARAKELVVSLERYICDLGTTTTHRKKLSEILFVEQYLNDRSSSIKMLLEHLAAVL